MDPVTIANTVSASESAIATAREVNAAKMIEGAEAAGEVNESIIGEQGLLEQMDGIKNQSIESFAARNESLLKTRNRELEGKLHPETGVSFVRKEVQMRDGTNKEVVVPEFSSCFETKLTKEMWEVSDHKQAKFCNEELRKAVEHDSSLKEKFNDLQLEQICDGVTPDEYTWHHNEDLGRMQLVDRETHMKTGHTGGREIWGGGR